MHLNASAKWNRLFGVIAVCWAIVSPFLLAVEADRRPKLARQNCTDTSYELYGVTDSPRFDVNRYTAETNDCNRTYDRDSVHLTKVLSAMVGRGDRILGLAAWGLLLIPLGFLLVISWAIRRLVNWIRVGFNGWTSDRKGSEAQPATSSRATSELT
jgi:hypothetical protein